MKTAAICGLLTLYACDKSTLNKTYHRITLHFCSRLKVWLKGCTDDHIIISKAKAASLRKWLEC